MCFYTELGFVTCTALLYERLYLYFAYSHRMEFVGGYQDRRRDLGRIWLGQDRSGALGFQFAM